MKKFNVTALGEILIDFTFAGISEQGMRLFEQNPGGAPANVLAAVKKLGGEAAFIGKVGDDMHGKFLIETIREHGIFADSVIQDKNAFTTLAFISLSQSGDRSFSFARKPGADTCLTKDEVDENLILDSFFFHIGSLSLTDEPAKSATLHALKVASENSTYISYDPNYRAPLWQSREKAIKEMRSVLPYVDIIKISDEEINLLTDCHTPQDAAAELLAKGISCVIITMGADGAYVATNDGEIKVDAMNVEVVDTTGAGDSFMGAFLFMASKEEKAPKDITIADAKRFAIFASKVSGICVSRRGAINAMPTFEEVK